MSDDGFRRFVFRRVRRMQRSREGGARVWAGLVLVGSVGWMVALPMAGGAMLGRWIDRALGTGLSFTLGLLLVGLAIGAYTVWRFLLRDLT